MLEKFKAAFGAIAYYNGHEKWLWWLSDNLRSSQDATYPCPLPTEEWCSDKHALWMMLVGVFGEWGTSIRSGWIEDKEGAAAFIDEVTDRYAEWRSDDAD